MTREELFDNGRDALERIKELVKKGNVRRVKVIDANGKTVINVPVTLAILGAVMAPALAGLAVGLALVKECRLEIEYKEAVEPKTLEHKTPKK